MTKNEADKVHGLIADLITQLDWAESELEKLEKLASNARRDLQDNRKRLSSISKVKEITALLSQFQCK